MPSLFAYWANRNTDNMSRVWFILGCVTGCVVVQINNLINLTGGTNIWINSFFLLRTSSSAKYLDVSACPTFRDWQNFFPGSSLPILWVILGLCYCLGSPRECTNISNLSAYAVFCNKMKFRQSHAATQNLLLYENVCRCFSAA
jgi:hypothetical protein